VFEDDRRPHLLGLLDFNTALAAVDKMDLPEDLDYDEFTRRLTERFTQHRTAQDYKAELGHREQGDKESFEEYGDELLELVRNAYPNADDEMQSDLAMDRFMKGARVSELVRERLYLERPEGLNEAIRTVRQLTAALRAAQSRGGRGRTTINMMAGAREVDVDRDEELKRLQAKVRQLEDRLLKQPQAAAGPSMTQARETRQSTRRCYECGEPGHLARECPRKREQRVLTCYNCSQPGHLAKQCPRQGKASGGSMQGGH
jgi:hypothetical protein